MEILDQLKQLKEDAINRRIKYSGIGICSHLEYSIVLKYVQSWDGFSGDYDCPVFDSLDDVNLTPESQYSNIYNLWQGRQLELRLSLIDHLIKCYEAELK